MDAHEMTMGTFSSSSDQRPANVLEYLDAPARVALVERLRELFANPALPTSDDEFGALAQDVARFQFERSGAYCAICGTRGIDSLAALERATAGDWRRIPAIPADAFRVRRIACFPEFDGEVIFHTSGTTSGRPGAHHLPSTELYDAGAIPWFAAHLLGPAAGGESPRVAVSLTPSPAQAPRSSLVHMIESACGRLGVAVGYVNDPDPLFAFDALQRAAKSGPVLVLATAFALVHVLDGWADDPTPGGARVPLPLGSRLMETGGTKRRSREIAREEMLRMIEERLGIPPALVINEYGMTEMSSQFYDGSASAGGASIRIHRGPPWVRTVALDPTSLEPMPPGEVGVLAHFDLANLDSCAFILTGDAGRVHEDGRIELRGRIAGAVARGCSLAAEELLSSQ